jgi:hypothetical protein
MDGGADRDRRWRDVALVEQTILRGAIGDDALEAVAQTAGGGFAVVAGRVYTASEDGTALVGIIDGEPPCVSIISKPIAGRRRR